MKSKELDMREKELLESVLIPDKGDEKDTSITIKLTPELKARFSLFCAKHNMSKPAMLKHWIETMTANMDR